MEGRLRYRSYDDKKGLRRYVTEIYAENMELLTPRRVQERSGEQSALGASTADTVNDGGTSEAPSAENTNGLPF